jgi:Protein of unknown function (DUF3303)
MKFMLSWKLHRGKDDWGCRRFAKLTPEEDQAERGDEIKLIGRWHDPIRGTGVVIVETDSAEALSSWALNWNDVMDIDIVPVLDDQETWALGKKLR